DLAASFLAQVQAPTLLIVGGNDGPVIGMNEAAMGLLNAAKELQIVPGAGHTLDQPGTLEAAARLACDWFGRSLSGTPAASAAPAKRKIQIALTRDQQLAFAAATGALVGVLEID